MSVESGERPFEDSRSTGIFREASVEWYRDLEAVSHGMLRAVLHSPQVAQHFLSSRMHPASEDQYSFGVALHEAVLFPGKFDLEYLNGHRCSNMPRAVACNRPAKRRYDGRWYCGLCSPRGLDPDPGAPKLGDAESIAKCRSIRNALLRHPRVAPLLGVNHPSLVREAALVWDDPATGIRCKCRPDQYDSESGILVDLKSSHMGFHPRSFGRRALAAGYVHQMAHMRSALRTLDLPFTEACFVFVQTEPPYPAAVLRIREADLDRAQSDLNRALSQLARCLEAGTWPGFDDLYDLEIPEDAWGSVDAGEQDGEPGAVVEWVPFQESC